MRHKLITVYCSLVTSSLTSALLSASLLLASCQPAPTPPPQTSLIIYRLDPPAFIEYSNDLQPVREIPFTPPRKCHLLDTFPAPVGKFLAIELNCPTGQTILFLDTNLGSTTQPVTDSDSHFLAWTPDGTAAYLRVNSLGNARVTRAFTDGTRASVPITQFTYDLAPMPNAGDFTFSFSRGLGEGSETWLAANDGKVVRQLYADPANYISFARYSPDASQIAFIKIPDSQTPYTVGSLFVMNADGSNVRVLAPADAGHGFAANWSPDGKRIAFVLRENPQDPNADQVSEALLSNIFVVDVKTYEMRRITNFVQGYAETPFWSPDGNTLAFNAVLNGRMTVSIVDVDSVGSPDPGSSNPEIKPLEAGSTCCPAWMRK